MLANSDQFKCVHRRHRHIINIWGDSSFDVSCTFITAIFYSFHISRAEPENDEFHLYFRRDKNTQHYIQIDCVKNEFAIGFRAEIDTGVSVVSRNN